MGKPGLPGRCIGKGWLWRSDGHGLAYWDTRMAWMAWASRVDSPMAKCTSTRSLMSSGTPYCR